MESLCLPDYDNSILNLVSSIAASHGVRTGYGGVKAVDSVLARSPETTVLVVFDGMGSAALERNLPPGSFLRRHARAKLTSVFPSTTVAAMTSFYTGLSPLEHGWLGWSLYFKEYARTIDTFLGRDSFSGEAAGSAGMARSVMPYEELGSRIEAATGGGTAFFTVNPAHIERNPGERRRAAATLEEFFSAIGELCRAPGRKYVLAYWPEPDTVMHRNGPYGRASAEMYARIDAGMSELASSASGAALFATADHGQAEVDEEVDLAALPEIDSCLAMPPFVECRAQSFFLVPGSAKRFVRAFRARFGKEFLLMPRAEVLRRGLLGRGRAHPKVSDFIGEYLAIGRGRTILDYRCRFPVDPERPGFKGHHAGLLPEEMLVPLIIA